MMSLLRIGLALALALTVCVAGWAGLHALGLQRPAYANDTVPFAGPDPGTPAALTPLPHKPVDQLGAAPFSTQPALGSAVIELRGSLPWPETDLLVRSNWSRAQVRRVPLVDSSAPVRLANLPIGAHVVSVVPRHAAFADSYFAKVPLQVAENQEAHATLTLTGGSLAVLVRDRDGQPLANAVVQVERSDDARWRTPHTDARPHLSDAEGKLSFATLGAGKYRLQVDGTSHDVEVPATNSIELRVAPR